MHFISQTYGGYELINNTFIFIKIISYFYKQASNLGVNLECRKEHNSFKEEIRDNYEFCLNI